MQCSHRVHCADASLYMRRTQIVVRTTPCLLLRSTQHAAIQHATCSVRLQVALEMRSNHAVPVDVHNGFSVEFVWKSISFDRMQASALPQQRQTNIHADHVPCQNKGANTMPQDGS